MDPWGLDNMQLDKGSAVCILLALDDLDHLRMQLANGNERHQVDATVLISKDQMI
jgi:hypothetical protein